MVAIVLFTVGGLFALYEAYHKWHDPHPIEGRWWWVPLVVLLAAIVMEGFSFRTAIRESNHTRGNRSWPQFVRTAKAPELPVVLLEDLAALTGLVFALVGVSLTLVTHDGRWDAVGSAAIGLLLVVVAVVLGLEMKSLLLGESASPAQVRAITEALVGDGVESVIHQRTLHIGPEELLVAAKVGVPAAITAAEVARAIDAAEQRVRAAVPIATVIYLEPDIDRSPGEARAAPATVDFDDTAVD
jgi:divalent metal cation (Fe/Co/Zn/Cd) transporter